MPTYFDIQTTFTTLMAFIAIVMAFWNLANLYKEAKQPAMERDARLTAVEQHLDNDNKRLKDLEDMTKLTLKAQLAIIDALTSDDPEPERDTLKIIQAEIHDYLINK